jgi:large subunit ribosomal protein L22
MQQASAKQTNIKMPARKIRRIIKEVQGKKAADAIKLLKFMPYFAARVVEHNLTAAIANASQKFGARAEDLKITEIFADESTTYKRGRPRAQGRMYKRFKRTSHLTVKLTKGE